MRDDVEDKELEEEVEEGASVPRLLVEEDDKLGADDRAWYVVHCYSGYENKVRHSIEQRIETMGMQDKIFDVVVPTEEEIEIKDGKRRTVERRVFPGYILVQMIIDEDSWYVVRNTPGVTGFVGMGNEPTARGWARHRADRSFRPATVPPADPPKGVRWRPESAAPIRA